MNARSVLPLFLIFFSAVSIFGALGMSAVHYECSHLCPLASLAGNDCVPMDTVAAALHHISVFASLGEGVPYTDSGAALGLLAVLAALSFVLKAPTSAPSLFLSRFRHLIQAGRAACFWKFRPLYHWFAHATARNPRAAFRAHGIPRFAVE